MKRWLVSILVAVCMLAPFAVRAAFHLFTIDELFSNADGTIQYVVLVCSPSPPAFCGPGENFWAGQATLTSNHAGTIQTFTANSNLPSSNTTNKKVLIATPGFAALNLVTPNYTIPSGFLPTDGGTISYAGSSLTYTAGQLPTDGTNALFSNGNVAMNVATNFAGQSASVQAPPPLTGPDLNQHGLTGSWYEPATSGQGFELEVFPNQSAPGTGLAFVSWFTFDTVVGGADRQRWYTLSGPVVSGQPASTLTIYQNTGGNFNAAPITTANAVGTAMLSFDSCISGLLTYTFTDGSGRTGSIPLTRLTQNVTCSTTGARPVNADFGLSGNWYDPNTSGQGFTVEVNPISDALFYAWYTYVPNGTGAGAAGQRWYTGLASGIAAGARSFPIQIRETTGGKFDVPAIPEPSTVTVGNATLTFQSCSSATFNYNFTGGTSSGMSGTIVLSRVGAVPPGCVF